MKHLCCSRLSVLFLLLMPLLLFAAPASAKKSAMVYYGDDISWSLAGVHDYIIVQPEHIDTETHGFSLYRDQVYAYVSVGEVENGQAEYETIAKLWSIGKNKTWHSKVLDIGSRAYGQFLLDKVIDPLVKRGFRHFFFDTLDSYMIVAKTPKERARMRQGLIWLIQQFHQRYPESKLILNRGFEVIDDVHEMVEAVLIESLFWGVSGDNLDYTKVSEEDRKWLKGEMKKLASYGLPVIVVDYLPSNEKEKITKVIAAIEALGAIPYIGDRHLFSFGTSSRNAVKREVLLLYDDTEADDKSYSAAFRLLSVPLEYMGYIPVLKPVTTWKLSQGDASRYAGAVVWLNGSYTMKHPRQFTRQVKSLYDSRMKLLMLESIEAGKHHEIFQLLGIKARELESKKRGELLYKNSYMGFEVSPYFPLARVGYSCKNAIPLCQIRYGKERTLLAALTPWGGYAFKEALTTTINQKNLWIANPFKLLREALRLPKIPVPDVTTENGRRLLFSHVDGNGMMNRAEWNPDLFSGEVLYEKVFSHYPVPISVSIIEGETAPYGLYPKLSPTLEKIASKIFALPNIEPATHTYTHPFYWRKIIQGNLDPKYRLKVKNYTHFSVDREIGGSLAYINRKLAPKGKRARMVFWSGDCLPLAPELSYVYRNHFLQINGGDTTINNKDPWLSQVAPLGLQRGNYYQVFTGAQNENVYTNDWLGPFWGFKRVIQTFKHTDAPRRFKPIDIYYHLYSGSKRASLKALKTVYEWAISQEVMPVYTSEYIPKVMDYYAVSIAKEGEQWRVCGTRSLRTLRVSSAYHADFNASGGVIGEKAHLKSRYLHLDTDRCHTIRLTREEGRMSYLSDANGRVVSYQREQNRTKMVLHAHVPLEMRFHRTKACQIEVDPPAETTSLNGESVLYRYTTRKDANVTIECH